MYVREEMPVEAILKGSAAKVLLHLIRRGGVPGTNAEMMRGSGVHDRNTYYVARSQLVDTGLWENPYGIFPQVGGISQQVQGKTQQGEGKNPAPIIRALPLEAEVIHADPTPTVIPIAVNWRERAMQADLLPGGGAEHQRTSEFQARRRVQVEALQGAWRALFSQELTPDSAKDLLAQTDNFAEDVFDVMETAKARNVQAPRGYILRVLSNKRNERAQHAATVRPANIGPATNDDSASDDNYYLTKPTEKTAKITAILKAKGLLEDDEDDD